MSPSVKIPILGSGDQTRAFCHIEDFLEGLMLILSKGKHMDIFHIGNPEEISIRSVAQIISKSLGKVADIIGSDAPAGETNRRCPDIKKLNEIGFQPKISASNGIPSVANWYANIKNGAKND